LLAARDYSGHRESVFEKQIPAREWAAISEKLYRYPGFFGHKRTLRRYPKPVAAHVLGYISEVSDRDINRDSYYESGDYIGRSGIERSYEEALRGSHGKSWYLVDVHNTVQGSYREGELDESPKPGADLISTLDRELQGYGEQLMQKKRGSIVAIEPSTGEVLTLVSSPGYDPNLLVGRDRSENYRELARNDSLDPLFNRATNAVYRPGSIFKLVQSLIGMEAGAIKPGTRIPCNRSIIACHGSHTNDDLYGAIQHSCNPYFHQVYKRLIQPGKKRSIFEDSRDGLIVWNESVKRFGLGITLETDIPDVSRGLVPDTAFYNRWYGKGRWAFSTIYSNSIGEGELGVVPVQMANLACILANKGHYYSPHLVRSIDGVTANESYLEKHETGVDTGYFHVVHNAMQAVVDKPSGTARRARIDSIIVCGKTGTVQNKNSPDHSVFIAFAPRENPQIAIAVYVEDSGFGGTWAAPVASLMIEKYLTGEISNDAKEQRILDADFLMVKEDDESQE
jgi:penicillin-binding protein 2